MAQWEDVSKKNEKISSLSDKKANIDRIYRKVYVKEKLEKTGFQRTPQTLKTIQENAVKRDRLLRERRKRERDAGKKIETHVGKKSASGVYQSKTPEIMASEGMKDMRKKYGGKSVNLAMGIINSNRGRDHKKRPKYSK